ncbi:IclR family transcriptional regulator [Acaricomes phytoseiuli]|uniref:IclR family transcriptional regulator n=1 Tax=Acaricomes phytoseiuli TaxID=291968 RepID=UPI0022217AA3|nr:IclR family transcriptional regulator [Acaricomes phytoseiuli]MCW1250235.1 IclR family transcriptional regulator [Acaricomes phytoseiuli]
MNSEARSQTLSRGLQTLETLTRAPQPLSVADTAAELGLHRSIVYRILRTLEDHDLVSRDASGRYCPGPGLAVLARSVARDLQSAAAPRLQHIAKTLGITAFLAVQEGEDCVTLLAEEPHHTGITTVAQRPGSRHPLSSGAPGIALQSMLSESAWEQLHPGLPYRQESREARERGYAVSHDEVIAGLRSVAAPIRASNQRAAAIAVVYLSTEHSEAVIGELLRETAEQITAALG